MKQKQQQVQQLLRDYFRMIPPLINQPLPPLQQLQHQLLMRIPPQLVRLIVQPLLLQQEMGFLTKSEYWFLPKILWKVFIENHLKDTTTSTTYSTTYSTGTTTTEEQYLFTDKSKPAKSTTAPRVTSRPTETINLITVDKEDEDDDAQERWVQKLKKKYSIEF